MIDGTPDPNEDVEIGETTTIHMPTIQSQTDRIRRFGSSKDEQVIQLFFDEIQKQAKAIESNSNRKSFDICDVLTWPTSLQERIYDPDSHMTRGKIHALYLDCYYRSLEHRGFEIFGSDFYKISGVEELRNLLIDVKDGMEQLGNANDTYQASCSRDITAKLCELDNFISTGKRIFCDLVDAKLLTTKIEIQKILFKYSVFEPISIESGDIGLDGLFAISNSLLGRQKSGFTIYILESKSAVNQGKQNLYFNTDKYERLTGVDLVRKLNTIDEALNQLIEKGISKQEILTIIQAIIPLVRNMGEVARVTGNRNIYYDPIFAIKNISVNGDNTFRVKQIKPSDLPDIKPEDTEYLAETPIEFSKTTATSKFYSFLDLDLKHRSTNFTKNGNGVQNKSGKGIRISDHIFEINLPWNKKINKYCLKFHCTNVKISEKKLLNKIQEQSDLPVLPKIDTVDEISRRLLSIDEGGNYWVSVFREDKVPPKGFVNTPIKLVLGPDLERAANYLTQLIHKMSGLPKTDEIIRVYHILSINEEIGIKVSRSLRASNSLFSSATSKLPVERSRGKLNTFDFNQRLSHTLSKGVRDDIIRLINSQSIKQFDQETKTWVEVRGSSDILNEFHDLADKLNNTSEVIEDIFNFEKMDMIGRIRDAFIDMARNAHDQRMRVLSRKKFMSKLGYHGHIIVNSEILPSTGIWYKQDIRSAGSSQAHHWFFDTDLHNIYIVQNSPGYQGKLIRTIIKEPIVISSANKYRLNPDIVLDKDRSSNLIDDVTSTGKIPFVKSGGSSHNGFEFQIAKLAIAGKMVRDSELNDDLRDTLITSYKRDYGTLKVFSGWTFFKTVEELDIPIKLQSEPGKWIELTKGQYILSTNMEYIAQLIRNNDFESYSSVLGWISDMIMIHQLEMKRENKLRVETTNVYDKGLISNIIGAQSSHSYKNKDLFTGMEPSTNIDNRLKCGLIPKIDDGSDFAVFLDFLFGKGEVKSNILAFIAQYRALLANMLTGYSDWRFNPDGSIINGKTRKLVRSTISYTKTFDWASRIFKMVDRLEAMLTSHTTQNPDRGWNAIKYLTYVMTVD